VNRRIARNVDVMIGNEEDFTAALGFEIEGAVAETVLADKLERLTAIGRELVGDAREIFAGEIQTATK